MKKLAASPKNIRRVRDIREAKPTLLGPKLGMVIYNSNVPASAVAEVLNVTEATLYRWIFGTCDISEENRPKVNSVGKKLSDAIKAGKLPVFGGLSTRREALIDVIQD